MFYLIIIGIVLLWLIIGNIVLKMQLRLCAAISMVAYNHPKLAIFTIVCCIVFWPISQYVPNIFAFFIKE